MTENELLLRVFNRCIAEENTEVILYLRGGSKAKRGYAYGVEHPEVMDDADDAADTSAALLVLQDTTTTSWLYVRLNEVVSIGKPSNNRTSRTRGRNNETPPTMRRSIPASTGGQGFGGAVRTEEKEPAPLSPAEEAAREADEMIVTQPPLDLPKD